MSVMKAGEQVSEETRSALGAERPSVAEKAVKAGAKKEKAQKPAEKEQTAKKAEKKSAKTLKAQEPTQKPAQAAAKTAETEQAEKTRTRHTSGLSKNLKSKVVFEFNGKQIDAGAVMKRAEKEAVKKCPHQVKTLEVYVNGHENAAYYVINGEGSDDYRIDL